MNIEKELKNSCYRWVKLYDNFDELENGHAIIDTSFINNECESITLYAKQYKKFIRISDFGSTIDDLQFNNVKLSKNFKVKYHIFTDILNVFNINYDNYSGNLYVDTNLDDFPLAKSRILQAIGHILDISYLNINNVKETFEEDFSKFLNNKKIKYKKFNRKHIKNVHVHFDLEIPTSLKTSKISAKIIKTISQPSSFDQAKVFNFDVKALLNSMPNWIYIAIINDKSHNVDPDMSNIALKGLGSNSKACVHSLSYVKNHQNILSNTKLK